MDEAAQCFSLQSHTTVKALTRISTGSLYAADTSGAQPGTLTAPYPCLFDTNRETINTSIQYADRKKKKKNNSHIYMINGKMSNMGRAFHSTHPESERAVNAVHGADSLAQLDI